MTTKNASSLWTKLAGTAAVAMLFNTSVAPAAGLIDDDAALTRYTPRLSSALAEAAGDDVARLAARGFMRDLEASLKSPSEKIRIVSYPQDAYVAQLQIAGVVPAKGLENENIPVCAEQNNKVLGTWTISPKGDVQPAAWSGATSGEKLSDGSFRPACNDFIVASRTELKQKFAKLQQQAPVMPVSTPVQPPASPSKTSAITIASTRTAL